MVEAQLEWGEIKSIVNDMKDLFSNDDDADVVDKVSKIYAGALEKHNMKKTNAREIIKALTSSTEALEREIVNPEVDERHAARLAELENEKVVILKNIAELKEEHSNTTEEAQRLNDELAKLQTEIATIEANGIVDLPRVKNIINLYANITKLKWDYASGEIAGHVSEPASASVTEFNLGPITADEGETPASLRHACSVANSLWDLIDPPAVAAAGGGAAAVEC